LATINATAQSVFLQLTEIQEFQIMKKIAFALSILLATSAHAFDIDSSTAPALAGGTVITFETVTPGSYTALTLSDVTFTPAVNTLAYVNADFAGGYNTQGQSLANTYASNGFSELTFTFGTPVKAFGFNWGAADNPWTLSAYDVTNTLLGSRTLTATFSGNAGDFFGLGFGTNIAFATLTGVSGDYVMIDNFTVSAAAPVPEPSAYGLALAGLAVLGLVARSKAG
jgi:hypothetical protein